MVLRLFLMLVFPSLLLPIANAGFLKKYPNPYFVETGTWVGETVVEALQAGFLEIHSVEVEEPLYEQNKKQFASQPRVHLWLGDSGVILGNVIEKLDGPITFWLDAHWIDHPVYSTYVSHLKTPVFQELEAIQRHPIKTHTILVDDVRQFGKAEFDFLPLQKVIDKIYEINPKYVITYEDGFRKGDILVAQVPKE